MLLVKFIYFIFYSGLPISQFLGASPILLYCLQARKWKLEVQFVKGQEEKFDYKGINMYK